MAVESIVNVSKLPWEEPISSQGNCAVADPASQYFNITLTGNWNDQCENITIKDTI